AFAGCASDDDDASTSTGSPASSSSGSGASGGEGGNGAAQGGAGGAGGAGGGSTGGGAGGQGGEATGGAGGAEGGAGGQGGAGGGGTCGVIGQSCVTGCGVEAQCWDGPVSEFCGPITPGCGGFAGAQCPASNPICMFYQGGDYGPCFTQEEKECVCAGDGKANLTGC
ncbi:MAG: hypothetical protein WKG00_37115, partial [Polyangiaceae bacterium]